LSFSNEITFATRAISELTMPFVTFEPRNKAMISTPGTLWPSAWSFLFFHVVLRGCPHVTVRAVHALSNVGYGMIFRDVGGEYCRQSDESAANESAFYRGGAWKTDSFIALFSLPEYITVQ
jgi:hypothetical protein